MKNLELYTDAELFDLVKGGHSFAFSEIYNRYWVILFRHAHRLVKDKDLAKDIVQEVFVSLWDKIQELELRFPIHAYLYKSVRNNFLNLVEKEKVRNNYLESLAAFINSSEAITDYRLREKLLKERIEKEIAGLPPKMRQIFEMSRKQNLSHKQIAKELNLSDKTVKKQMSNAIKILRLKLGDFIVMAILLKLISI